MSIPRSSLVWDETGSPNKLHEIIASAGHYIASSNTSQYAWSGSTSSAIWIQSLKVLDQLVHNLIQSHSWAVTQLVICTCTLQWDLVHLPVKPLECCSILMTYSFFSEVFCRLVNTVAVWYTLKSVVERRKRHSLTINKTMTSRNSCLALVNFNKNK